MSPIIIRVSQRGFLLWDIPRRQQEQAHLYICTLTKIRGSLKDNYSAFLGVYELLFIFLVTFRQHHCFPCSVLFLLVFSAISSASISKRRPLLQQSLLHIHLHSKQKTADQACSILINIFFNFYVHSLPNSSKLFNCKDDYLGMYSNYTMT
jgi:hypothetical protein